MLARHFFQKVPLELHQLLQIGHSEVEQEDEVSLPKKAEVEMSLLHPEDHSLLLTHYIPQLLHLRRFTRNSQCVAV